MKNKPDNDPLIDTMRDEGHIVAEGQVDVLRLIHAVSGDGERPLCSGFRVFPDGSPCMGCADCVGQAARLDRSQDLADEAPFNQPDCPL